MNKIIQQQLEKTQIANLTNFNSETNSYIIPKYSQPRYEVGKCYIVKLSPDIINNTNSVLATNWNAGIAPVAAYYKIYVNTAAGKMIKVDGLEYNFEQQIDGTSMFSGWLNIDDLTQLKAI